MKIYGGDTHAINNSTCALLLLMDENCFERL